MSVTLPYKIALGCSAAALVLALGVRLMGGGDLEPATDLLVGEPEVPVTESVSVADAEASPKTGDTAEEADRSRLQAPSKAPPTVPDALLASGGAMGSDAGSETASQPQPPPTLTVGRAPEDASPSPVAAVVAGQSTPDRADTAEAGSAETAKTYTVRSGDTFEGIARRELGASSRWVALAKANPTVDPLKLRVGDVLRLPSPEVPALDPDLAVLPGTDVASDAAADAQLPPPPDPVTYVVRSGDSLSTIAARFYADSSRWQAIFNANRDQLKSPHAVRIGMELRIPPAIAAAPGSLDN
ncbi:MAG: LysM peptidoglycan-binding domain-containing protein [Planctomycetota bacterium]